METKKLIRPQEGRVFFGVCAGIANYFSIDPIIVRLVFIVLTIWGGAGVLIYIICIFLMPEEKAKNNNKKKTAEEIKKNVKGRVEAVAEEVRTSVRNPNRSYRGEMIFGLIVLLIGIIFLFQNFFSWLNFGKLWPLILILLGLIIIASRGKETK